MSFSLLLVVPTLNSWEQLPLLVTSLQDQSWSEWRVLFVDGNSSSFHTDYLDQLCLADPRFSWITQDPSMSGIFGAMNQGFLASNQIAHTSDLWILFWGSDDYASSSLIFQELVNSARQFLASSSTCDLIVCRGRYVSASTGKLTRASSFGRTGLFEGHDFRRALFWGSTPPHQGVLFGPSAYRRLARYDPELRLSADLDYFLQLSKTPTLRVQSLNLELVHMSDSGVSGQQLRRRLHEVRLAYLRAFAWRWWIPFVFRYIRRIASSFANS